MYVLCLLCNFYYFILLIYKFLKCLKNFNYTLFNSEISIRKNQSSRFKRKKRKGTFFYSHNIIFFLPSISFFFHYHDKCTNEMVSINEKKNCNSFEKKKKTHLRDLRDTVREKEERQLYELISTFVISFINPPFSREWKYWERERA